MIILIKNVDGHDHADENDDGESDEYFNDIDDD